MVFMNLRLGGKSASKAAGSGGGGGGAGKGNPLVMETIGDGEDVGGGGRGKMGSGFFSLRVLPPSLLLPISAAMENRLELKGCFKSVAAEAEGLGELLSRKAR